LNFFKPCHDFIDEALKRGENVMVHCLAGAHRAGTTGVSYMMKAG
jgi:protein-tyrosine phosphatase